MRLGLSFFPLGINPISCFFVPHWSDGNHVMEYGAADSYLDKLARSPRKYVLSVTGGDTQETQACGPLRENGFWGIEKQVVHAIGDSEVEKPIPSRIHPGGQSPNRTLPSDLIPNFRLHCGRCYESMFISRTISKLFEKEVCAIDVEF
jgi:hypothetical protein